MKKTISLLFLIISLSCFSQTKEIKASKKTLEEAAELKDIITDIPKDCKIQSYILSFNAGNDLKEYSCMTNIFSGNFKFFFSKKEKGFSFFVEKITSGCENSPKGRYKITIE